MFGRVHTSPCVRTGSKLLASTWEHNAKGSFTSSGGCCDVSFLLCLSLSLSPSIWKKEKKYARSGGIMQAQTQHKGLVTRKKSSSNKVIVSDSLVS